MINGGNTADDEPQFRPLVASTLKITLWGPGKPCGSQRRRNLIESSFMLELSLTGRLGGWRDEMQPRMGSFL